MIIDMPNTRTREIAHKIEQLHEERGESATGSGPRSARRNPSLPEWSASRPASC